MNTRKPFDLEKIVEAKRQYNSASARDSLGNKRCRRCARWLPTLQFSNQTGTPDLLSRLCRDCNEVETYETTYRRKGLVWCLDHQKSMMRRMKIINDVITGLAAKKDKPAPDA